MVVKQDDLSRTVKIESSLSQGLRDELVECLRSHVDVFAWSYEAINTEIEMLLRAKFIKEANYLEWISNVVLVKKTNGKWRMCINFKDLNKACPKNGFPLPKIDQLVDSMAGRSLLSFIDAFSRYNQIPWTSRMRRTPHLLLIYVYYVAG